VSFGGSCTVGGYGIPLPPYEAAGYRGPKLARFLHDTATACTLGTILAWASQGLSRAGTILAWGSEGCGGCYTALPSTISPTAYISPKAYKPSDI
tara:strand:- start:9 stop:293 length:285 start_codon:yes stop_codon:yes gene_type:complete